MLNALPTFRFERIQTQALLFFARSMFRAAVAPEAEEVALNDDVNVFRKSLDEFPRFCERRVACASLQRRRRRSGGSWAKDCMAYFFEVSATCRMSRAIHPDA
jgi:hypothetical protein